MGERGLVRFAFFSVRFFGGERSRVGFYVLRGRSVLCFRYNHEEVRFRAVRGHCRLSDSRRSTPSIRSNIVFGSDTARPPGFPAPGLDLQQLDGGARIARFPAVGNAASIQAGSRDIREIPDPSRSLALGSKDDTRLFAATEGVCHVRLQP
jgi:hypothetical protein